MAGETCTFIGSNGLQLAATRYGDTEAQPVVLAHGGGQTRRAWGGTAEALAGLGYHAITIDLRGHGDSEWCDMSDYRIEAFAQDYVEIRKVLTQPPILVGASLGGIAAMVAAGELDTHLFRSLVLVDVTPHMEMSGVEKIVEFMTANLEQGFASVEEAAEAVSAYLPHRPKPKDLSGLAQNLRQRDGRYFWHWDPGFMTGANRPAASRDPERLSRALAKVSVPIMLVRGRMSELVSEENAQQFLQIVPHAHYVDIADAHHMVAGDRNDAFTQAVAEFIGRVAPANVS